jgi:hypothetical protein
VESVFLRPVMEIRLPLQKIIKFPLRDFENYADRAAIPKIDMELPVQVGRNSGSLREDVGMKIVLWMAVAVTMILMVSAVPAMAGSDDSEYVIVANKEISGDCIDVDALKVVYQREVKTWKNSKAEIIPVDLFTETGFYQNLFGKSYLQMQTYWMKMRSNYSMDLPVFKKDSESVKQFIAANKDAIGFIKSSDVDDSVKVIKLIN